MSEEGKKYLADVSSYLSGFDLKKDAKNLVKDINSVAKMKTLTSSNEEKVSDIIDELENQGELIVAYKSPIIQEAAAGEESNVSNLIDGGTVENDIKFIGWHFFHPDLNHTDNKYYSSKFMKKIKSKIIKKASKTGHKKKGGVARLKIKNVGRGSKKDKAYVAFYWYTYYTEDIERDCFERMTEDKTIIVDSVMRTENGSIVEVEIDGQTRKVFVADANVRKGDYVTVDGVKYRVN